MKRCIKNIFLLLSAVSATHCALFGGGESSSVQHSSDYKVSKPEEWKKIDRGDSDSAYELPSKAIVSLTSACNQSPTTPLETLTRQLLIGSRNVKMLERKKMKLNEQPALYSAYTATFDGAPMHLLFHVHIQKDCIFDFSLIKKSAVTAEEKSQYFKFIESFQTKN